MLLATLTLDDAEVDALGWRPFVVPLPTRPRRGHAMEVEVAPLPAHDREALVPVFWTLLGDLGAEVLLDGTHGPWEDALLSAMTKPKVAA